MRVLRGLAAILVWLLATVVMIVALVLCVTLILLPLGAPLMALGLRLWAYGVQLMLPRGQEVKRKVRKQAGLKPRGSTAGDVKRAKKQATKKGKKTAHRFRKGLHKTAKAMPG
ncbi:hypothetical protein FB561_2826 [Kribbella amoyensis]|uniref:Uncharacterized protein n=1 Tax=Kribbella amoyensis TaxID=996641 RepID=A0A561BS49_9ACTN|nr:hypothetical protein [Kribbella amoyensis]TWD81705.1 hypothetical protein FB561_2826 [Kribbella amoyensis]